MVAGDDVIAREDALAELNVTYQARNVSNTAIIQDMWIARYFNKSFYKLTTGYNYTTKKKIQLRTTLNRRNGAVDP